MGSATRAEMVELQAPTHESAPAMLEASRGADDHRGRMITMRSIRIPLTLTLTVTIDEADQSLIDGYPWYPLRGKSGVIYAAYKLDGEKPVLMHRLISGAKDGERVDHTNGVGLDNRRCNLRVCNQTQNSGNRRRSSANSSGYKGVSVAPKGRFRASIRVQGSKKSLGFFDIAADAALAYDCAAREVFGEFACLNFPRPGERSAITGEVEV